MWIISIVANSGRVYDKLGGAADYIFMAGRSTMPKETEKMLLKDHRGCLWSSHLPPPKEI